MTRKYDINPEKISDQRTICEVHRELYRMIDRNQFIKTEALELVADAYDMAKRMAKKLEEYSRKRGHDFIREYMDD